jgi:uncharacterized integral membrane protein
MDLIGWLLRLVFFVLALWFALQNTAPVPLRLSPTQETHVPLVIVILGCFVVGAVAGMLALVPHFLRQRRRIATLSRAASQQAVATDVAAENLTDVARSVGAVGGLELDTRTPRR